MKYAGRHRHRAYRLDQNHAEIKSVFEDAGAFVIDLARHGVSLDLLVCWQGKALLVEIKMPGKALTDNETEMRDLAAQNNVTIHVVETKEQALELLE